MRKIICVAIAALLVSCSPFKAVYLSRTHMELLLVNDSVAQYRDRQSSGVAKYKIEGSRLITSGETKPNSASDLSISDNETFQIYNDSIVLPRNKLVLYKQKFFDQHELGETFYYIRKHVKYKVSPQNAGSKARFRELDSIYESELLPLETALREYDVDPNFDCWRISDERKSNIILESK